MIFLFVCLFLIVVFFNLKYFKVLFYLYICLFFFRHRFVHWRDASEYIYGMSVPSPSRSCVILDLQNSNHRLQQFRLDEFLALLRLALPLWRVSNIFFQSLSFLFLFFFKYNVNVSWFILFFRKLRNNDFILIKISLKFKSKCHNVFFVLKK